MTQGRAGFRRRFRGYEEAPNDVASRVIDETVRDRAEELAGAH
jgi:translation elongation factor EF-G